MFYYPKSQSKLRSWFNKYKINAKLVIFGLLINAILANRWNKVSDTNY